MTFTFISLIKFVFSLLIASTPFTSFSTMNEYFGKETGFFVCGLVSLLGSLVMLAIWF